MPRFWLYLCIVFTLPLSASLSQAAEAEIVVMGDAKYRPVVYQNRFGRPAGLLVDVLRYYSKVTGQPITVRLYPWSRAYASALAGEGGIIGLTKTKEREELFDYSAPIYDDDINVVVRADRVFDFLHLEDLKGKKFGVQLGASYGEQADNAIAAGLFEVEPDLGPKARLLKVLYGRMDGAFIGNGQIGLETQLGADPELAENRDRFVVLERPLTHDALYLGFAKSMGMRAFLDDFDRVLEQARGKRNLRGLIEDPEASQRTTEP